jgi:NTE family protein
VLASASIPLLFPPVPVGGQLYMDGGLRQNTPLAPALRLGATHVLVVGTSRRVRGVAPEESGAQPTTAFVLGKIMNALLLDHLDNDLGQVELVNELLECGTAAYGERFVADLNSAAARRGRRQVHPVRTLIVRPSIALGALGGEFLRSHTVRTRSQLARRLLEWFDSGREADLASYLLFDGAFTKQLVELGRADARAQRQSLGDFFAELDSRTSDPPEGEGERMSFHPPAVG